jgi:hypothetical protein
MKEYYKFNYDQYWDTRQSVIKAKAALELFSKHYQKTGSHVFQEFCEEIAGELGKALDKTHFEKVRDFNS